MQQRLRRSVQARAAEPPSEPQPTGTPTATADEQQQGAPAAQVGAPAPVQAGPRGARKAGKQQQQQQQRREQRREPRPIPIKGMVTKQQQQQQLAPGEVRWDDNKVGASVEASYAQCAPSSCQSWQYPFALLLPPRPLTRPQWRRQQELLLLITLLLLPAPLLSPPAAAATARAHRFPTRVAGPATPTLVPLAP
jgi:hypothetical protein